MESLKSTFNELSHVKLHSVAQHSKPTLGKRKLKQVEGAVSKKLATVLKVDESELEADGNQKNLEKDIQSKADDLDFLVECMKEKLKISNRKQKLQILTLIPNSWSVRKATEEFHVSKSTIQKAKILRAEKGIIVYQDTTKQQRLTQELLDTVTDIYFMASFLDNFLERKIMLV